MYGGWLRARSPSAICICHRLDSVCCWVVEVQIMTRNLDWRDDKSFFTATLAVDPHASYMRTSLGALEWSEFHQLDALEDWKLALADNPDNAIALSNLGMAMIEEKRWQEAEV